MKKYSAKYFINKYEAIPEEKWTTGSLHSGQQSCALGHLGARGYGKELPEEALALCKIIPPPSHMIQDIDHAHEGVIRVNDGHNICAEERLKSTPKQRIIAALHAAL